MKDKFVMKKSEIINRASAIMALNLNHKMNEIRQNYNKCSNCHNHITEYSISDPPTTHSISSGDSPEYFRINGNVWWSISCPICHETNPVIVSYLYDNQSGYIIESNDFFMNENYNYGHYKKTIINQEHNI